MHLLVHGLSHTAAARAFLRGEATFAAADLPCGSGERLDLRLARGSADIAMGLKPAGEADVSKQVAGSGGKPCKAGWQACMYSQQNLKKHSALLASEGSGGVGTLVKRVLRLLRA